MFRLGAVLVCVGIGAFCIGGFALAQPYQILALIAGGLTLMAGIVVELMGGSILETLAAETGVEALLMPGPEVAAGKDMLGADIFPQE
ncbi:hypothetical protein R1A27_31545 (plasmid) [Methylobacterium sp. NMS12]|uniref:hypothetical protein n=1 Tax=Methylobacterium sp. NMS12 TaxID=3079766 RepID=UPI003F88243D